MAVFLSAGLLEGLQEELLRGAYGPDTPAALVYKASWPGERVLRCTVGTLAETGRESGIDRTALVLVGDFLGNDYRRSKLYDPAFTTGFGGGRRRGEGRSDPDGAAAAGPLTRRPGGR